MYFYKYCRSFWLSKEKRDDQKIKRRIQKFKHNLPITGKVLSHVTVSSCDNLITFLKSIASPLHGW
jgi:hypothetical protein